MTATKSKTMADLKRLAAKVGATIDSGTFGFGWDCHVDLPKGKVIMGAHSRSASCDASDKEAKKSIIAEQFDWLSNPIEDGCEIDNPLECDTCNPLPEND
jgi:hypothetical protein